MNLHGVVASQIGAVNPFIPADVRINTGQAATAANGTRAPLYATPGLLTGSLSDTVLTVASITTGQPMIGQTLAGAGIAAGTLITAQLTGDPGGVGTYSINKTQTVASGAITTALILRAQVQPVTWRDIQQMDGLNLQGTRVKIYLHGAVDGLVRPERKGGDLIIIADGVNRGTYLVAQNLEQWPDWVSCATTLQNGA